MNFRRIATTARRALAAPRAALNFLGRHGARAAAASAVAGLMLPAFSATLRPWIPHAIFALLVLAFLRVEPAAVARRLSRPMLIVAAVAWMMAAIPLGAGLVAHAFHLETLSPQMMLALFIVTAAPPVMSAPAFAFLMGLDGALSLTVMVACVLLTPLAAPFVAGFLLADALPLDPLRLAMNLGGLLAGSIAVAWAVRRLAGRERIEAARSEIDGVNVILLFAFIIAAMDGVVARFMSDPMLIVAITALTFAVAFAQIAVTYLGLRGIGRADAFTIALAAGNRNMGLMVAAMGASVPDLTWLYFALGQFPIYMLPMILKPLARRMAAADGAPAATDR
ncbi:sodium:proton symporter [Breoghania sp. JC706]|uniref:sodium:proton symporter n=1 Tax=Breoghania sp. JC706 TaxID=3117732 RepID=UPI00300B9C91